MAALPIPPGAKRRAPNNDIRKRIGKQLGATPPHSKPPRLNWAPSWPATSIQASWLENNAGLAVFTLPDAHRKRMRTSNGIERPIQQELKRRTSKVRVFPNLASLERFSTAVLIDEKWETETKIKWEQLDQLHDNFQTSGCVIPSTPRTWSPATTRATGRRCCCGSPGTAFLKETCRRREPRDRAAGGEEASDPASA